MKYKSIFFDFDGTLFNTIVPITIAINRTLKHFGIERSYTEEQAKFFIGSGTPVAVKRALKDINYNEEKFDEILKYYVEEQKKSHLEVCDCYDGVIDTLKFLKEKGIKLFVVTNKPEVLCKTIIEKELPSIFDDIVSNDGRFDFKPSPDGGNFLIKKYSLNRKEILFVGDSHVDYETALNLNLDFGLCTYGYEDYSKLKIRENDILINNFVDLKKV